MRPTLAKMISSSPTFDIRIISDTVCPWCYIGYKRLSAGIATYRAAHPNATFRTTWSPFYLNPAAPSPSVSKQAMYESKFGAQRTAQMQARLSAIGDSLGIQFAYGGKTGRTRDSHRLVQLGKVKGLQTRVVEELFKCYFEREGDISDLGVLGDVGVRAGLDAEEVREWLEEGKGGAEVDVEVDEARESYGVTGVPYFVVNDRWAVAGAEEGEVFARLFEKITEKEKEKEGRL